LPFANQPQVATPAILTPAIALLATTQKAAQNGQCVKQRKRTVRAKKPKVACPYCGELKRTRSNGSSKGSWLRECMNKECAARFYRVDPITHKASVLENGHRGPVKHVIKETTKDEGTSKDTTTTTMCSKVQFKIKI